MTNRPNIGGRARTVTLTLEEIRESTDRTFQLGIDAGLDMARDGLRAEITEELRDELERFDPDCPMCTLRRAFEDLQHQLEVSRSYRAEELARARGWIIRTGGARGYFETR